MTVRHPQRETEHPSQHLNQSRTLYPSPDTSVKTSSETLSKEEKHQERAASGSCFYCGKPGHFIDVCKFRLRTIQGNEGGPVPALRECGLTGPNQPNFPPSRYLGATEKGVNNQKINKLIIQVWLFVKPNSDPILVPAMIDTGADGNFMDMKFITKYNIPVSRKQNPVEITGIDGKPLGSGKILEETCLKMICQGSDSLWHSGLTQFDVIGSPNHDIILGLPWLRLHVTQTNWSTSLLCFNSEHCKVHCQILNPVSQPVPSIKPVSQPVPSIKPVNQPVASIKPVSQPASRLNPVSQPVPSIKPVSQPVPSIKPVNQPVASIKPVSQPASRSNPVTQPAPSANLATQPASRRIFVTQSSSRTNLATQPAPRKTFKTLFASSSNLVPLDPDTSKSLNLVPAEYSEYSDVFDEAEANKLPPHRPYDCAVNLLPDQSPPYCQIYPLSPDEDCLAKEQLDKDLKRSFIRRSTSSAGAPIFFVDKEKGRRQSDGKVPQKRLVVNYKGLDKITEKFRYPLPLIPSLIDQLHSAKIFTKIDLRSAYNLLRIREGDEWKTAFRTKYGLFEYLVMPFGLANAPAYFQCFVNEIFADMLDKFVIIYLDDFLIYSEDPVSHRAHVRAVLQRLRENRLFAKLEKCEFSVPTVKFLGLKVSANGITSDEDQVKSIVEWPAPRSKKDIQKYLGVANYLRKFVLDFAKITTPLTRLLKKNVSFLWTPECQTAFESLKKSIVSAPALSHANPEKTILGRN